MVSESIASIKSVKIVYYSGTGNTKKTADIFQSTLKASGADVATFALRDGDLIPEDKADLLLLVYAVHALNAPKLVYAWIKSLPPVNGEKVAVISVSAGGEISPNTACRVACIRRLEKKGYDIIYEKMLVMPSNGFIATPKPLAVMLLEVLPTKIKLIVDELQKGSRFRKTPPLLDRILSSIGELEKHGAIFFGKWCIKRSKTCNGCEWCAEHCPAKNIKMQNNKPLFMNKCHMCLNCLYGCPKNALSVRLMKFILIKEGYSLKILEDQVPNAQPINVEELAAGYLWKGVRDYLLNASV